MNTLEKYKQIKEEMTRKTYYVRTQTTERLKQVSEKSGIPQSHIVDVAINEALDEIDEELSKY
jgi:predicted DNA-binding protein